MMLFGGMPALVLTCRRADRQMSRHVGCVSAFGGKCHDISRTWREPDLWQMSKNKSRHLCKGRFMQPTKGIGGYNKTSSSGSRATPGVETGDDDRACTHANRVLLRSLRLSGVWAAPRGIPRPGASCWPVNADGCAALRGGR